MATSPAMVRTQATWGLLGAWAVHDLEELVTMAPASRRIVARLRARHPWVPDGVWERLEVAPAQAAVAVGLVGGVMAAAATASARSGGRPGQPRPVQRLGGGADQPGQVDPEPVSNCAATRRCSAVIGNLGRGLYTATGVVNPGRPSGSVLPPTPNGCSNRCALSGLVTPYALSAGLDVFARTCEDVSLAGENHGMHASPFAWRDTVEHEECDGRAGAGGLRSGAPRRRG